MLVEAEYPGVPTNAAETLGFKTMENDPSDVVVSVPIGGNGWAHKFPDA
jgi:hypothetical protein